MAEKSDMFGMFIAGSGFINGGRSYDYLSVSEETDPNDYKIIDDWIGTIGTEKINNDNVKKIE